MALHILGNFLVRKITQQPALPLSLHAVKFVIKNFGLQPETNVPPFDDMYIREVCNWTYHWVCLKNTGCFTERQTEEVDKNDDSACLGCAHLNDEHEQQKHPESTYKKLIHVTWEPTWEPEEGTLPTLLGRAPCKCICTPISCSLLSFLLPYYSRGEETTSAFWVPVYSALLQV